MICLLGGHRLQYVEVEQLNERIRDCRKITSGMSRGMSFVRENELYEHGPSRNRRILMLLGSEILWKMD